MSRSHARAVSAVVGVLGAGVLGVLSGPVGSAHATVPVAATATVLPGAGDVSSPDPHIAPLGRGHWGGHRYWGNGGWGGNWGGGWGNGWGNNQGNGWGNDGWHGNWGGGGNSQN
ncbi:hypothetical protein KIH27_17685 [Mycobacterium sp. M1]|uniref:Uncharacterized protein n=1 Tax=Mycolicibacter acidiphilus TaxID=2835306 RepID=A0ABS5RPA2_9MYCO|nr:hypothetical protein [Mycolicibacter acidiphilus]MBS9535419.1 hypothetical protein [Mycolicibacter acidiphilus]